MNEYEYEYQYEFRPTSNRRNAERSGADSAAGPMEYEDEFVINNPLMSPSQDTTKFLESTTMYSETAIICKDTTQLAENWDKLKNINIISWDLLGLETGTKVKFEFNAVPTIQFQVNLHTRGHSSRLGSNAYRLQEEINADVALLDSYKCGGITRYAGANDERSIQLLITQFGRQDQSRLVNAYLIIGDQRIIKLPNKWYVRGNYMSYSQANIDSVITAQQAVEERRAEYARTQQARNVLAPTLASLPRKLFK